MPKKNIEKNTLDEFEGMEEENIEKKDVIEEVVKEEVSPKPKKELPLADIELKIRRIDYNGLFVVDKRGSGMNILVPERYSKEKLKVGDTIYVSKSEL